MSQSLPPGSPVGPDERRRTILFVADEEELDRTAAPLEALCGHEVVTARTPDEARRRLEERSIDILLLDVSDPADERVALAIEQRSPGPQIVVQTSVPEYWDNVRDAVKAPIFRTLWKPVSIDILAAVVLDAGRELEG